ncbi:MAG: hypothetical protein V3W34_15545 [Phycisphaerae bacterium]
MRHAKEIARQVHRTRAAAVVEKDLACRWVADKPEILDELGRIPSDHALLVIARRLCAGQPTVDKALELIRQHRQFDQLADNIIEVVNEFCRRKPTTTHSEILRALEAAGMMLARVREPGGEPGQHQFLRKIDALGQGNSPAFAGGYAPHKHSDPWMMSSSVGST